MDPSATCGDVKRRAEAKVADIERRIKALQQIKRTLVKIVAACKDQGSIGECPILEALGPLEKETERR